MDLTIRIPSVIKEKIWRKRANGMRLGCASPRALSMVGRRRFNGDSDSSEWIVCESPHQQNVHLVFKVFGVLWKVKMLKLSKTWRCTSLDETSMSLRARYIVSSHTHEVWIYQLVCSDHKVAYIYHGLRIMPDHPVLQCPRIRRMNVSAKITTKVVGLCNWYK